MHEPSGVFVGLRINACADWVTSLLLELKWVAFLGKKMVSLEEGDKHVALHVESSGNGTKNLLRVQRRPTGVRKNYLFHVWDKLWLD